MSDTPARPLSPQQLRAQAEAVLAAGSAAGTASAQDSAAAASKAMGERHELEVSQIELEMQQVALADLHAQKRYIEDGLRDYAALYEHAPASYFSLNDDGRIVRANRAATLLCGCSKAQLLGAPFERFVAPHEQARWRGFLRSVFEQPVRQVLELPRFGPDGQGGLLRIEAQADAPGGQCRMLVTDLGDPAERDAALRRAFVIFDTISEGVLVTDAQHHVVSVNPAFAVLTGYRADEVIGRDAAFVCDGALARAQLDSARASVLAGGTWQGEVGLLRRDGKAFLAWLSATVTRGADGAVSQHVWVLFDISARKAAELALQQAHRELDSRVAERTADLLQANVRLRREYRERERAERALDDTERFFHTTLDALAHRVLVLDERGVIVYANLACRAYARHAGAGTDYLDYCMHRAGWQGEAGHELAEGIRAVTCGSEMDVDMEYTAGAVADQQRHFQVSVTRFGGPGPVRVVVAHTDISERKAVEEQLRQSQLQLRQLAAHLETVKEEERKRIARDIHDELGQNMLALRIDISMLGARTGLSYPRLHRRVAEVLDNLDTTIRSVRGIINDLRPPVLDLGLLAAIEWQAGDFRRRSGIVCELRVLGEPLLAGLHGDVEIVLFRVVQEALTNVMRHAHAERAEIDLHADGSSLHLTVQDDGIGISEGHRHKPQCFGLIGMSERIAALGGQFEVASSRLGGCLLSIHIPL